MPSREHPCVVFGVENTPKQAGQSYIASFELELENKLSAGPFHGSFPQTKLVVAEHKKGWLQVPVPQPRRDRANPIHLAVVGRAALAAPP